MPPEKPAELVGGGFFPGKGSMAGRLVIPIHNSLGELVAYAVEKALIKRLHIKDGHIFGHFRLL